MKDDERKQEDTTQATRLGDAAPEAPKAQEETAAEEAPAAEAEEAPAAEEPAADAPAEAEAEPNPEDDLPWKERRRLQRSRQPHKAGPALTPEERASKRA